MDEGGLSKPSAGTGLQRAMHLHRADRLPPRAFPDLAERSYRIAGLTLAATLSATRADNKQFIHSGKEQSAEAEAGEEEKEETR